MQILTSTLLKIPLYPMAQPLSGELTRCPLVEKAMGRRKRKCAGKVDRARTREDFLTNLHDSNLIFPQGAASLNLSEFKFNEKYPPYALKNR